MRPYGNRLTLLRSPRRKNPSFLRLAFGVTKPNRSFCSAADSYSAPKKQRPSRMLLSGLWACGTPQVGQCFVRLRMFRLAALAQRHGDRVGKGVNHFDIGLRRLVGLRAVLFPIAQGRERYPVALAELLLG